jgi:hypothetical protein
VGKEADNGHPLEVGKVDKPVLERGGYSSSDRTPSELPMPPQQIVRIVTDSDHAVGTEQTAVNQQQAAASGSQES